MSNSINPNGIGRTHGGIFHADDVFSSAILLLACLVGKIIRGGTPVSGEVVFDVGGEYSDIENKFDHHQKGGPLRDDNPETPYSSAGLIWKRFGEIVCRTICPNASDYSIQSAVKDIDDKVVRQIDLIDNGKFQFQTPNLSVWSTVVNDCVPADATVDSVNHHFGKVVEFTKFWIANLIQKTVKKFEDEALIKTVCQLAIESKSAFVVFDEAMRWQEALLTVDTGGVILFVIYPDKVRGDWKTQTVPKEPGSFEFRLGLPEELRGKSEVDLEKVIPGLTFIHPNGFIAASKSLEAAIEIALMSLAK